MPLKFFNKDKKNRKQVIEEQEKEIAELNANITKLEMKNDQKQRDIIQLHSDKIEYEETIVSLEGEVASLKAELHREREDHSRVKEKHEEVTELHTTLVKTSSSLQQELEDRKKQEVKLERMNTDLSLLLEDTRSEKERQEEQIKILGKKALSDIHRQHAEHMKVEQQRQKELHTAMGVVRGTHDKLREVEAENIKLQKELDYTKAQLEKYKEMEKESAAAAVGTAGTPTPPYTDSETELREPERDCVVAVPVNARSDNAGGHGFFMYADTPFACEKSSEGLVISDNPLRLYQKVITDDEKPNGYRALIVRWSPLVLLWAILFLAASVYGAEYLDRAAPVSRHSTRALLSGLAILPASALMYTALNTDIVLKLLQNVWIYWIIFNYTMDLFSWCLYFDDDFVYWICMAFGWFLVLPFYGFVDAIPEEVRYRFTVLIYSSMFVFYAFWLFFMAFHFDGYIGKENDTSIRAGQDSMRLYISSLNVFAQLNLIFFAIHNLWNILRSPNAYILWRSPIKVESFESVTSATSRRRISTSEVSEGEQDSKYNKALHGEHVVE